MTPALTAATASRVWWPGWSSWPTPGWTWSADAASSPSAAGFSTFSPPTAEHPVRVEFWGDEITEMRMFSVADQRSIPEISVDTLVAVACRELLLTDDVRARAAQLAAAPGGRGRHHRQRHRHAGQAGRGHPGRRHGGAAAGASARRSRAADRSAGRGHAGAAVRPGKGAHPGRRPDQDRPRVPRGVVVGRRPGGTEDQAPVDVEQLGGSGFAELDDVQAAASRSGHPVVDVEPAVRRVGDGAGYPGGAVGSWAST